jgi:response regulator of citrate/malate metabolism
MAAKQLHRVVNLIEPEEAEMAQARKAELRRRMYQALDSDPELQALRDWYLSRSGYFGYKAMEQEGLCSRNKGYSLIVKAQRLAGVECRQREVEMARKVAECYEASSDKRLREVGKQLGLCKTSVRKWLNLARHLGMLSVEKTTKQRVREAIQNNPTLSYTQIAEQLGISKTTVLFWKNILRDEKLLV